MNVLVINAGSSSLKYQLINLETKEVMAKGLCECLGSEEATFKHSSHGGSKTETLPIPDHDRAVALVLDVLTTGDERVVDSLDEIDAVGHRIVQGGSIFDHSVIIDETVTQHIDDLAEISPLHNKAALEGIYACQHHMPSIPMVAVFDSSFFHALPQRAKLYPLPLDICDKHAIRRYGAHGTSHRYISQQVAALMGKDLSELKVITCHLGNGCSITAIDHGTAVDTSMGLTPLDGLMMGTRCGSIDPAIVTYLIDKEGCTAEEVNNLMNKKSGLLGVSGVSNDMRAIKEAANKGNERAKLALEMFAFSVKKYIGAYVAVMGGVDCIAFAGGIGENDANTRHTILENMEVLGIVLDEAANAECSGEGLISAANSPVSVYVVPTDEELMIALDTYKIVQEL